MPENLGAGSEDLPADAEGACLAGDSGTISCMTQEHHLASKYHSNIYREPPQIVADGDTTVEVNLWGDEGGRMGSMGSGTRRPYI